MTYSLDIQIASLHFQLLSDRGMFWPATRTLFIADTHFGKEATFRRAGIPIPAGSTDKTLAHIVGMIRHTGAARLCILGDMFHARTSLATSVKSAVSDFFNSLPEIEFLLVRGNHDLHVGNLPTEWPLQIVEPGYRMQSVVLGHHPIPLPHDAEAYLCGHIHPAVRVRSGKETLGKLPCFWHSRGVVVLPAIGNFTGTHLVEPDKDDDVWIVGDNEVFYFNRGKIGCSGG